MSAFIFVLVIIIVLCIFVRRYANGAINESYKDLKNKVVLITGTTQGIGYEAILKIAEYHPKIIMLNRRPIVAHELSELIKARTGNSDIHCITIDLADIATFPKAISQIKEITDRIDIFIPNAGLLSTGGATTKQGYELSMGTNHLSHFLLFKLLKPLILKSESPRVVVLSSLAHLSHKEKVLDFHISGKHKVIEFYNKSKLANAIFAKEISVKYPNVTSVYLHPGVVFTNFSQAFPRWAQVPWALLAKLICKSPWQGCQTTLFCVFSDSLVSGEYYADCKVAKHNSLVDDADFRKSFWVSTKNELNKAEIQSLWKV